MLNSPPDKPATHPTDDQLQSVVNGYDIRDEELQFVVTHLESCQHCQTRADRFDSDPLFNLIQQSSTLRLANAPKISAGYELIEETGRGAAGVVYRALQPGTDRIVAVKMLVSGANSKRSDLARFRREAQALSQLDHPNVVKVFEVGEQDGIPFLAMEWIEGVTLSEYLKSDTLGHLQTAKLVGKLASGIEHVHRQGILHRDLKPQNILIPECTDDQSGDAPYSYARGAHNVAPRTRLDFESVKICDFGLARLAQTEGFHTRTGETLGTPAYMAPEQIGSHDHLITEKTDVYGLGAILYECLSGRPPFHGSTPLETLQMVVDREPVAISALSPNVPKDLEVICHRCLSKNPKDRFQNALELQQDLERFVQNRPIDSRPVPAYERALRWAGRNPWPVAVAVLLIVAVTTVIVSQWNYSRQLSAQRDEAISQYREARAAIWEMLDATGNESDFEIPPLQQLHTNQAATALKLFDSLSLQEGTQDSLMDLGRVQMLCGSGLVSQGKTDDGIELFQRSRETFENLLSLSPDNLKILAGLVSSQVKLGHTLNRLGKTEEASQILQASLPLADRLHQLTPGNVANANLLAWTHHNTGSNYVSAEKHELAAEHYQSAVKIRERARQLEPENDELLRYLAESQVSLAACQMSLGSSKVENTYLEAIKTFDEIQLRNPHDINAIISNGVAYLNYSNILAGKDDALGAIEACSRGITLEQTALAANPDQHDAKNYISMLFGNRAMFRSHIKETEEAVKDWQSAIEFSVNESTENFCRCALIRDLVRLSLIDEAVAEMAHFDIPDSDQEGRFQLATSWGVIYNRIARNGNNNSASNCLTEITRILTQLGESEFFSQRPTAQATLMKGDDFREFRHQLGNEVMKTFSTAGVQPQD